MSAILYCVRDGERALVSSAQWLDFYILSILREVSEIRDIFRLLSLVLFFLFLFSSVFEFVDRCY